jgi:formate dehydrogenase beta subunit
VADTDTLTIEEIQGAVEGERASLWLRDLDMELDLKRVQPSTCTVACPAGINVKTYLALIAAGKFDKALDVVKEQNPLPGICGRVCTHPCETECKRGELDEPVAICALKRFIADYEVKRGYVKPEPVPKKHDEPVAIVGSGPAGLTAAYDLAKMGYPVTIFEAASVAGGMLILGIPSYRLPRDIIETEIRAILDTGVELKLNAPVGDLNALFEEGYKSIFLGIGAHTGRKMRVPGEDEYEGFLDCIKFLRRVNEAGNMEKPGRKVCVIGGGNSAIDSARTALRLGSDAVHIVYRRSRKEMPANEAEIVEAEEEGVEINYLTQPVRILGEEGKVTGMECVKMRLGDLDSSGRRRPIPIEGSEFVIETDCIVPAISQQPDISFLPEGHGLEISRWNSFVVNEETLETNLPGIYAGGDSVTGPLTVIDAIAAGHRAALSIHRYLRGPDVKDEAREIVVGLGEKEWEISFGEPEKLGRKEMPKLDLGERASFDEVELGLTEAMAVEEAKRCLRCGPCQECYECVAGCIKNVAVVTAEEGGGSDHRDILLRLNSPPGAPALTGGPVKGELRVKPVEGDQQAKAMPVVIERVESSVAEELCRGCGDCEKACEYGAIVLVEREDGKVVSRVDPALCKGCGVCASVCPTGAAVSRYFTDMWADRMLVRDMPSPKVAVFCCSWFPHTGSFDAPDLEGIPKVRVLCSGRISPALIVRAFELGAEGVIAFGCKPGDCHYVTGSEVAEANFDKARDVLRILGVEPGRVRLELLSRQDGADCGDILRNFMEGLKQA